MRGKEANGFNWFCTVRVLQECCASGAALSGRLGPCCRALFSPALLAISIVVLTTSVLRIIACLPALFSLIREFATTACCKGLGDFSITLLAASMTYMFALTKGFNRSALVRFLRRMCPGKKQVFYDRLDFVITVLFGSFVGTVIFSPHTAIAALSAGFGWVSALKVLTSSHATDKQLQS
jgi:hypothetical protein